MVSLADAGIPIVPELLPGIRWRGVPSVILGERNYVLNPAHSDFARIEFAQPETFRFDLRLISREPSTDKEAHSELA